MYGSCRRPIISRIRFIKICSMTAILLFLLSTNLMDSVTSGDFTHGEQTIDARSADPGTGSSGSFIENIGQFDEEILFVGETGFGRIILGQGSIFFDVRKEGGGAVFEYFFEGSKEVTPSGLDELPGRYNYFIGDDPDLWIKGARTFSSVLYEDIWEGIDLKYTVIEGNPKYEFLVRPGADPDDIRIRVNGHDSLRIEENMIWAGSAGEGITDGGLFVYQPGSSTPILSSFTMKGGTYSGSR